MKLIVETHLFPEQLIGKLAKNSKAGLDFAAHNLSQALLKGFEENDQDVFVLNVPSVGSFPVLNKCFKIPEIQLKNGISVQYNNIPVLKRKEIVRNKLKHLKRFLKSVGDEKVVYITYNLKGFSYLKRVKEILPTIKICSIITDLPQFMNIPTQYGALSKLQAKNNSLNTDLIDGFILFAPLMKEPLNVGERPWIHMEGIYNPDGAEVKCEKEKNKTILYTGNLGRKYGVMEMLKAFSMIDSPDYRLWIRGGGECENIIRQEAERDKRIVFFESMGRKQIIELQQKATVLLNPVKPSEEFTRYFFPSKTLEYMASGTPVLMYHLACMPQEYGDYIYYMKDESVECLRDSIINVCSKPSDELNVFGLRACEFINNCKTPKKQLNKIINFVKEL